MVGDEGPYVEMDGPRVWVPRTVPYLEARKVARAAVNESDQRLRYLGKCDALLLGFTRDCQCEEVCERQYRYDDTTGEEVETGDNACKVPAWAFLIVDPWDTTGREPSAT
jgi:hypothetical protein